MENQLITSNIKLTIGMLVSNRIQHIRNVMEGLKPLLDAIPSELIVIDTKGAESDGSIEIVKEYTDKIYPFEWCNDFAAARNVCLEHAQGEWFLYQDDDEWFDDVTEFIEFFNSDSCEQYNTGLYYTRDYSADGTYSTGIAGRIIRRRNNTRFVGKVHESFNEAYTPAKQFSCFTHHYGYAFKTLEEAQKHQERNVSILKAELERTGYTAHLCAQMTQELIYLETSTDEGFSFANTALEKLSKANQLSENSAQWIMYATVLYFLRNGNAAKAAEQIAFLKNTYPLNKITSLVLEGIAAELALENKDTSGMLHHASCYLDLWDWKEQNKETAATQTIFNFPYYSEENYYFRMVHIAAAAANAQEQYRLAKKFWNRLPLGTADFDIAPYYQDFSVTLNGLKKVQLLQNNHTEYLQQVELLEQACQQAKQFFVTGNLASAAEYLEVIQQFVPVLEAMFKQVFSEKTSVFSVLENFKNEVCSVMQQSLTEASFDVLFQTAFSVKVEFCREINLMLDKNA